MRLAPLLALPPLLAGVAAAAWFVANAPEPGRIDADPPGLAVRVTTAQRQDIRPVARAWGNVRPAESWTAIAEVPGTVIWRHPDLEPGRLIAGGTEVLRLDPTDFRLAIDQLKADLAALQAESAQIDAEAENTARVLALEEQRLASLEGDLKRVRELVRQGASPRARADETERAVLAARRGVTELRNAAALIAPRRQALAAQIAKAEAALARTRHDLERTRISTPYDLRVTRVDTADYQFVGVGQRLFAGDAIDRAEIVAQIPIASFRRLLAGAGTTEDVLARLRAESEWPIRAEVRLIADPAQVWQARVTGVEGALDPRARTVPVVVEIADPYGGAVPPLRLPLVPNMQMEIVLTGEPMRDAVTVPAGALHGNMIYVADDEDRLEIRPVRPAFLQDGLAVIAEGLEPGTRIVTDDIAPAIPGMKLTPVEGRK